MSKTKQSETEKARLQGVWRAAAKAESGELFIPCPDLATARNLRFALYNAVRVERQQPERADAALADALDRMQLGVTSGPAGQAGVMIRQKAVLALTDGLLAAIPGLAELAKTSEQAQADESAARMQERLAAMAGTSPVDSPADGFREPLGGTGSRINPFFTREGAKPGASS